MAPAEQPLQRRHRARRHHVERARRRAAPRPGRAPPRRWSRARARRPPRRGTWYGAAAARPASTRRSGRASASTSPGSPAPDPMSQTRAASRHQLGQHGAVEQVPLPEPRHLARADQPAHDAVGRQQVGVPLGQRQPATANTRRAASAARRVFHVKHRSSRRRQLGQDHDEAARLDALGLRRQAGRGDGVVHDLALERRIGSSSTGSPDSLHLGDRLLRPAPPAPSRLSAR